MRAYLGEVIAPYHSPERMREDAARVIPQPHPADLGWARIMVHEQGDASRGIAPVYEGAFSANGVIYHLMTKENYLRNKLDLDPSLDEVADVTDSGLVIWRETDVMSLKEETYARTGVHFPSEKVELPQSCGHDRLDFNHPSQNPMMRPQELAPSSWIEGLLSPFMNDTLYRRDDVGTGSSGNMGTK